MKHAIMTIPDEKSKDSKKYFEHPDVRLVDSIPTFAAMVPTPVAKIVLGWKFI
jgi:hypothetical protein